MFATCRTPIILRLGDSFHIGKIFIDLIVKFGAVSDNYESPVTLKFAQDFLRKEHHRKGFAAALCMPEDAESAPPSPPAPLLSGEGRLRTASNELLTPRNWWFLAMIFCRPPLPCWKRVKFSTKSSKRDGSHTPLNMDSSEMTPSSPSLLIFFHSEKCSHLEVIEPRRE